MADARSLLRARRQEARISHPLASYNAAGQLRCAICGILVKYASAWEGHLGSKAHRTNIARVKEEERLKEEARLAAEREEEERERREVDERAQIEPTPSHKRKAEEDERHTLDSSLKKQKLDAHNKFPDDFFSDPSQAPVLDDESDEEGVDGTEAKRTSTAPSQKKSAIDLEYERFQKELLEGPDFRETYERATVIAEPVMAPEVPEGFPAPTDEEAAKAEEIPEMTEEEKRRQKEIEEKELIMDRLLEEERAQEDADMKVEMMKKRLEAFKKQRQATRAAKAGQKSS